MKGKIGYRNVIWINEGDSTAGTKGLGDRIDILIRSICIVSHYQKSASLLYEVFDAWPDGNGGWDAGSGAIFDLTSNSLRPDGWTSADAAGLPILPGLVRYDEMASGEITHAIRFTADATQMAYLWPARHYASSITNTDFPPMGLRLRLKANFDISGFSTEIQVILQAMKTYGIILSDNGSSWYISGAPHASWDDSNLNTLKQVPGTAFEVVQPSGQVYTAADCP